MVDSVITHAGMKMLGLDLADGPDQSVVSTVIHVRVDGLIHPHDTITVALEGIRERAAQDLKWGESNHPDAPAGVKFHNAYFGICTEEAAKKNCEHAFRSGGGSNAHILIEEVAEAIAAIPNPPQLRAELVQVMAVCMKWVEQIDRREGFRGQAAKIVGADEMQAAQEVPRG